MENTNSKKANADSSRKGRKNGTMREEISLELAEIGNMTPKQDPMTPNQREKSESEKWYP